jgi:hypothetical protein
MKAHSCQKKRLAGDAICRRAIFLLRPYFPGIGRNTDMVRREDASHRQARISSGQLSMAWKLGSGMRDLALGVLGRLLAEGARTVL